MSSIQTLKQQIEQIRKAHASARPTNENPAWQNTHHDLGVALIYIAVLEQEKTEQGQEPKQFDPNESFEREEANQARVREFMRNH